LSKNTIPETNKEYTNDGSKFIAYDRIYSNLHKSLTLIQKNGSVYQGKIDKKSIKLLNGTLGHVHVTADNRWFDSCGMPISKPTNLITHK
jgi:hypothetical protein